MIAAGAAEAHAPNFGPVFVRYASQSEQIVENADALDVMVDVAKSGGLTVVLCAVRQGEDNIGLIRLRERRLITYFSKRNIKARQADALCTVRPDVVGSVAWMLAR